MNSEQLQRLMVDKLNGALSAREAEELEQYLSAHHSARQEMEELEKMWQYMDHWKDESISDKTRSRISEIIRDEVVREKQKSIFIQRPVLKTMAMAASIILALGIGYYGFQYLNEGMNDQQASSVHISMPFNDNAGSRIRSLQQVALQTGINTSFQKYLLNRLNHDPDTNVRLMALEMLLRHAEQTDLKKEILTTLDQQTSPHVQWVLIHMAGVWKLESAIPPLETLLNKPETDAFIKQKIRHTLEEIH